MSSLSKALKIITSSILLRNSGAKDFFNALSIIPFAWHQLVLLLMMYQIQLLFQNLLIGGTNIRSHDNDRISKIDFST